jgi:glycosyltransferase involved in cell wall biosynthesis
MLAQTLRNGLRERGVDAYLLTSAVDAFDDDEAPDGLFWGTSGPARCFPEIFNPSARVHLKKALREFKPDVVHLLMFMTQASPAILPLLTDRPVVYTANTYRVICPTGTRLLPDGRLCVKRPGRVCHSNGCLSSKGWLPRMAQLRLLERWRENIRCVVAPSAAMAKELERGGWPVSTIIHYGVEQYQRSNGRAESPCIAYAGRLVPEKGCDILLHAFARVLAQHPNAHLLVAGDGPERARLQALAVELVGDHAVFLGQLPRSDLQRLLESAWVQVVSSLWVEPFGLVTAEAMMRGTAVVATRSGGQAELIEHGVTGFLVSVNNIGAMADALCNLCGDRNKAVSMGNAGRRRAERLLSLEQMFVSYLSLYGRVAADMG